LQTYLEGPGSDIGWHFITFLSKWNLMLLTPSNYFIVNVSVKLNVFVLLTLRHFLSGKTISTHFPNTFYLQTATVFHSKNSGEKKEKILVMWGNFFTLVHFLSRSSSSLSNYNENPIKIQKKIKPFLGIIFEFCSELKYNLANRDFNIIS